MPRNLTCCLCGGDAGRYGHNIAPLYHGDWESNPTANGQYTTYRCIDTHLTSRCCDTCNTTKVIPARIKAMGLRF